MRRQTICVWGFTVGSLVFAAFGCAPVPRTLSSGGGTGGDGNTVGVSHTPPPPNDLAYYTETYRPQVHFSPAVNWGGDVSGAVFANNVYHVFYDYNAYGTAPGHMSWGHALSRDLLHWTHTPVVLWEDTLGAANIGTGAVVSDVDNTASLCTGMSGCSALVAVYTDSVTKFQAMAHSLDGGITWVKDSTVIAGQSTNTRGIKVFWDSIISQWVAVVTSDNGFLLYTSNTLRTWLQTQKFVAPTASIWDRVDLFALTVQETSVDKWVLLHEANNVVLYTVGSFDGSTFTPDDTADHVLDSGPDYYGVTTYNISGTQESRRIAQAILRDSAPSVALTPVWSNAHAVPRQLVLHSDGLHSAPAIDSNVVQDANQQYAWDNQSIGSANTLLSGLNLDVFDATVRVPASSSVPWALRFRVSDTNYAEIGFDPTTVLMHVDRSHSVGSWNSAAAHTFTAAVKADSQGQVTLRVLVDRNSIELFDLNGGGSITTVFYPDAQSHALTFVVPAGTATVSHLEIHGLRTVWPGYSQADVPLKNWSPLNDALWASTDTGMVGIAGSGHSQTLSRAQIVNDFIYEADIEARAGAGGLLFRAAADGVSSAYLVQLDAVAGQVTLNKWQGGALSVLASATVDSAPNNGTGPATHHVRVMAQGAHLQVFYDAAATSLLDFTDLSTPYLTGFVGLDVGSVEVCFDHLRLTTL